jgi:3-hydroxyacyl-CoA dehydrogenase
MLARERDMATNIRNVSVLSTGVLGPQIVYHTAYPGFAYGVNDKLLETARERIETLAERYEQDVEGASDRRRRTAMGRVE